MVLEARNQQISLVIKEGYVCQFIKVILFLLITQLKSKKLETFSTQLLRKLQKKTNSTKREISMNPDW